MKTKHLLLTITLGIVTGLIAFLSTGKQNEKRMYTPRYFGQLKMIGQADPLDYRLKRLVNPSTGDYTAQDVDNALKQIKELRRKKGTSAFDGINWEELGPDNVGGRTRAILIDKDDHNLIFAGSVSGGLWKSTTGGTSWEMVESISEVLSISSACQTANGDIYIGTGEGFTNSTIMFSAGTSNDSKIKGQGIWKSTDHGQTFTRLSSTWDDSQTAKETFCYVNEIVSHPTNANTLYASTHKGLHVSTDGGATWSSMLGFAYNFPSDDVAINSNGVILASVNDRVFRSETGAAGSITSTPLSTASEEAGKLCHAGIGRWEFAFSPSNPNYVYAVSVTTLSRLKYVYKSVDAGLTWSIIGTRSNQFAPFTSSSSSQGLYDCAIAVFPDNPENLLLGGVYSVWTYEGANEVWTALSQWYLPEISSAYVHADQHEIVFHPDYASNKSYFIGSDGGISKYTPDHGFRVLNKKYNVTQFYAMAFSATGEVVGGTQDNGSLYINGKGNTAQTAVEFSGGDGAYCFFSNLNPDILYTSTYYGTVYRSDKDKTDGFQDYYSLGSSSFVTPMRLWESYNDVYSKDSVLFINDTVFNLETGDTIVNVYQPGDVVFANSLINDRPIPIEVQSTIEVGDTIKVQDPYQAMLVFAGRTNNADGTLKTGYIAAGRNVLNLAEEPKVFKITNEPDMVIGEIQTLEVSRDGDYIWFCDLDQYLVSNDEWGFSSKLYRCKNVSQARKYSITYMDTIMKDTTVITLVDIDTIVTLVDSMLTAITVDTTGYLYDSVFTVDSIVLTSPDTTIYDTNWTVTITPQLSIDSTFSYVYVTTYDSIFNSNTYQVISSIQQAVENFNTYSDTTVRTEVIKTYNQAITGIAIDPNDPDRVLVTLGNYGTTDHIEMTTNGTASAASVTFTNKDGDLPDMPVYCAMFEKDNSNIVLIGTEFGMWGTDNISTGSPVWNEINANTLGNVPVFMIGQQVVPNGFDGYTDTGVRNSGYIYIATHGRGLFSTDMYADEPNFIPEEYAVADKTAVQTVKVYPNPVTDVATVEYSITENSDVTIKVYDLYGKVVFTELKENQMPGIHTTRFDSNRFTSGTYIVTVDTGKKKSSSKILVY